MTGRPTSSAGNAAPGSLCHIYVHECASLKLGKPNSGILAQLPMDPKNNEDLLEIDLSENIVGPKGLKSLLPVIGAAPKLRRLLLNNNYLTNDSVQELAQVLTKHRSITHLDLSGNRLTASAGKELLALVRANPNIIELSTKGTVIRPLMSTCIASQLSRNFQKHLESGDDDKEVVCQTRLRAFSFGLTFEGNDDDEVTVQRQLLEDKVSPCPSHRKPEIPAHNTSPSPNAGLIAEPKFHSRGRRQTVSSTPIDMTSAKQFQVHEYPKEQAEMSFLTEHLSQHSLFAHLDDRELSRLVKALHKESFRQRDFVYQKGEYDQITDSLYIIYSGTCQMLCGGKVDNTLEEGNIFGEVEVMHCTPRDRSVQVTSKTMVAFALDRETYSHLMVSTSIQKRELHYDALKVGFLKNLTHAEKLQIADALEPCAFDDGEYLIHFGEEGQWFYIILEGNVDVYGRDATGAVIPVCTFGPGDFVGELEFIHNHPTVADVRAKGPCRTVRMSRLHFELCMGPAIDIFERHASADNPSYLYYHTATGTGAEFWAKNVVGNFRFGLDVAGGEASPGSPHPAASPDASRIQANFKRGRRKTVSSEVFTDAQVETFSHSVVPKAAEDTEMLYSSLKDLALFSQLDDRELQIVIESMAPQSFKEGDLIIQQGEMLESEETYFYFISQGECTLLIDDVEQRRIGEKDFFGELELLHMQPRQGTIRAASPEVQCWVLNRPTYRLLMMGTFKKKRAKYGAFLRNIGFLRGLTSSEFAQLADALEPAVYKKGDVLINYGEPGHWFHIIVEGSVKVVGRNEDGHRLVVCHNGPGDCVGELEFMYHHKAVADVIAETAEVRSVRLNRTHFELCMGPVMELLKQYADEHNSYEYYHQLPKAAIAFDPTVVSVPAEEQEEEEEEAGQDDEEDSSNYFGAGGFTFGATVPDDADEAASPPNSPHGPASSHAKRRNTVTNARLGQEEAAQYIHKPVPKSPEDEGMVRSILQQNFLFSHLDDRELTMAVEAMFPLQFAAQEVLYEEGSVSSDQDHFLVISKGELAVLQDDHQVQSVKPGDTYGDVELMYSQPTTYTVRAETDVHAWALDRQTYRCLVSGIFAKKRALYGEFLAKVSFLKPLSKSELYHLADALVPHNCVAGEHLIKYGQEADWFYIIVEGVVEVWGRDSEDTLILVCDFTVGDCVGELEFLNNHQTMADVVAKTDVRAAKLNRAHFEMCMGPVKDLLGQSRETDEKFTYYNVKRRGTFIKACTDPSHSASFVFGDQLRAEIQAMLDEPSSPLHASTSWGQVVPATARKVPKDDADTAFLMQAFKNNRLFDQLQDSELEAAVDAMAPVSFQLGHHISVQGDKAQFDDQFIVISSGMCAMAFDDKVIKELGPGDVCGEVALLRSVPCSVDLRVCSGTLNGFALDRCTYQQMIGPCFERKREQYFDFLRQLQQLKCLTQQELLLLADAMHLEDYEAGEYLLEFGKADQGLVIIMEGTAEIIGRDGAQQPTVVCDLGEGKYIGHMEILDNHRAVVDVRAKTAVRALKLDSSSFQVLMGPAISMLKAQVIPEPLTLYYEMADKVLLTMA